MVVGNHVLHKQSLPTQAKSPVQGGGLCLCRGEFIRQFNVVVLLNFFDFSGLKLDISIIASDTFHKLFLFDHFPC